MSAKLRAWLTEESAGGFVRRFSLLFAVVVLVSWALALTSPPGVLRHLVPASVVAIIGGAFLWRRAEALLAFALVVLFHATLAGWIGHSLNLVDELGVAVLFLIAVPSAVIGPRRWMWWPRELAVVLLVIVGVLSSVMAAVPVGTWLPALALLLKSIAFLYVVMWSSFRVWELRAGMGLVLAVGSVTLVLGFVEMLDPPAFQQALGLSEYARTRAGLPVVKSLFVHPVLFAWFTAYVSLFLFSAFVVTRRWRWLIAALLFAVGPFVASRRRAILAVGGALALGLMRTLRPFPGLRTVLAAWGPVAAGFVLLIALFLPAVAGLYDLTVERYIQPGFGSEPPGSEEGFGENPQARITLYLKSTEIARDYLPLGAGLGRYGSWMSRVDYSPLYEEYGMSDIHGFRPANPRYVTDTFWPQILGETGVIGLGAYAAFIIAIALQLWRAAGRTQDPLLRMFTLGAGLIVVQAIVESLASAMFHSPPRIYLTYLAAGVVLSLEWRRSGQGG